MCVIAYAKPGVDILDETIKKMFEHNNDGAGIMWKPLDGGDIQIRKGFMKVEDLLKAWADVPTECEKAIHCRIATSGKVSQDCCHPFPVRPYTAQMKMAVDHAPIVLMHNGVFSFCTPKGGMQCDYSDTMQFAAQYIYPLRESLDNEAVQDLLERVSSSRLLILRTNGEAIRLGDWEEKDGVFFSNLNHDTPKYSSWSYASGSYYGTYGTYQSIIDGNEYTSWGYDKVDKKYYSEIIEGEFETHKEMHDAEVEYYKNGEVKASNSTDDLYAYEVTLDVASYFNAAWDDYPFDDCADVNGDVIPVSDMNNQDDYYVEVVSDALFDEFTYALDANPKMDIEMIDSPVIDYRTETAVMHVATGKKYKNKSIKKFFKVFADVVDVKKIGADDNDSKTETADNTPSLAKVIEKVA